MRRLTLVLTILAMLATALPAAADDGERDEDGHGFGPFASGSTDSGTCGNDWANDTFKRFFEVTPNADGSFTLREDFRDGHFVTIAGASPGACEIGTPHGATIGAGVRGEFHGFLAGRVTGGTFTPVGGCPAPCSSAEFLAIHFGVLREAWDTSTFRFRYEADGHDLQFRRWQNASPDQGGNLGDIAN